MIVYLDTNVYIGAKYQFSTGKFELLRSLISNGDIQIIFSSATRCEVEQHIRQDVTEGVSHYNRVLRKELQPLLSSLNFDLCPISEEVAVRTIIDSLSSFLSMDGVYQIDLNPLDAERLMIDFFQGNFPFESKKPYEFKDAIMINAVIQYQKKIGEKIVVVSNDNGFRKAFEGNDNFIVISFLGDLLKLCQEKKKTYCIENCIQNAVENNIFSELIKKYYSNFDIDRGYYSEWECEEYCIESLETYFSYVKCVDGKYQVHVDIVLYLYAKIIHMDDDSSYYDKEEQRYLIQNFVTWQEEHKIETETVITCSVEKVNDNEYVITESSILDDGKFHTLDLDEDTMIGYDEIDTSILEEPDLIYCSECGKAMGYTTEYTDYHENPLCGDCMVANSNGDICPSCGKKIPFELMNSGFCLDCLDEQD